MEREPALDQTKMEAFVHKVLGDTSATMITILAVLGDRLGLFKDLAAHGPATSSGWRPGPGSTNAMRGSG